MHYTLIKSENRPPETTVDAFHAFVSTWDFYTFYDIGPSLTCRETETMCDMLAAFSKHEAADALREGHIGGDDHGDLNHNTMCEFEDDDAEMREDRGEAEPVVAELVAAPLEIEA